MTAAAFLHAFCAEFEGEGVAYRVEVEPVRFDKGRRLDDDVVDVANELEALVEVLAVEAEPLAEQFHKIDNLEAAPLADIADLAVAGMIDRRQGRDPGIGDRLQLALDELALELRQLRQAVGLRPDARHVDVDELG